MAQDQIIEKLNAFLNFHAPFSEENHAVYFLVEVRKIIDQQNAENVIMQRT